MAGNASTRLFEAIGTVEIICCAFRVQGSTRQQAISARIENDFFKQGIIHQSFKTDANAVWHVCWCSTPKS